jgi:hypothetical protein
MDDARSVRRVEAVARLLVRLGGGTVGSALLRAGVGGAGSALAVLLLVSRGHGAAVGFAVLSLWCWAIFGVVYRWGPKS